MALRIGIYSVGPGKHHDVARFLLESLQKHMPGVPVHHLTDEETEALAEPIRRPLKPLAMHRIAFYAELEGDWLFLDTDIVVTRDVTSVFDQDFDIAYAERNEVNDYALAMPMNLGVIFSRKPQFWQDIFPSLSDLPPRLQDWDGGQLAAGWYATRDWCPHKVLKLPAEYNYAPKHKDDVEAAILHYKGKRKQWLGPEFAITHIRPN